MKLDLDLEHRFFSECCKLEKSRKRNSRKSCNSQNDDESTPKKSKILHKSFALEIQSSYLHKVAF